MAEGSDDPRNLKSRAEKLFRWLNRQGVGIGISVFAIIAFFFTEIYNYLAAKEGWPVDPTATVHAYWVLFLLVLGIFLEIWSVRTGMQDERNELRRLSKTLEENVHDFYHKAANRISNMAHQQFQQRFFVEIDDPQAQIWAGFTSEYLAYNPTFGMDVDPRSEHVNIKRDRVKIHFDRYAQHKLERAEYVLYSGDNGGNNTERRYIRNFLIFMYCIESHFLSEESREKFLSEEPKNWKFENLGKRVYIRLVPTKRMRASYFLGTKLDQSGTVVRHGYGKYNFGIIYVAPDDDGILSDKEKPRVLIGVEDEELIGEILGGIRIYCDDRKYPPKTLDNLVNMAISDMGVIIPPRKQWTID